MQSLRAKKMETTEDVATTSVAEENPPAESSPFPDLSVLPRLAEFASETTINEIRSCIEFATRGTVAVRQSSALFPINAIKQLLRSSSIQSLLARQSSFQSTPRSIFANDRAASNCQSSSLFAVDTTGKSHEFSNSSCMIAEENDSSPSTNLEDINATPTVKAQNPSLPDTKSPFNMQTLLDSLENLPENVQQQVMYKLYMLGCSRNRSNSLIDTVASALAVYSASNNESIMHVVNRQDRGNQSGNDSDREGKIELSTSKQLTPFRLKANAPDGAGINITSSNSSHHVHSLHSSELQDNPSSDEMHTRFGNLHLSHNTEKKCDLTIANKSRSPLFSVTEFQRIIAGEMLYDCPVCKITFRYANMLKVHAKHRHNETHPFHCTVCPRKFDRHLVLVQHMYSHGVSPTYKCEICGETFKYHPSLINHSRVVHYKIFGLEPPHPLAQYPIVTLRERSATRSSSAVLGSRTEEASTSIKPEQCREVQLFSCLFCGKNFSHKSLLSQHMKSHEFSTTYKCETCGQTFSFQSSLAKHRVVHFDGYRFSCSMCDMTFTSRFNLRSHQATHLNSTDVKLQTKRKPWALFSSRTEPNPTAMSRRGLKREFSCLFCAKSFDKKILLSRHMKSHEWRPFYKCETCGETFNFQSSLMKHQSVHSESPGHTSPPGVSSSY